MGVEHNIMHCGHHTSAGSSFSNNQTKLKLHRDQVDASKLDRFKKGKKPSYLWKPTILLRSTWPKCHLSFVLGLKNWPQQPQILVVQNFI